MYRLTILLLGSQLLGKKGVSNSNPRSADFNELLEISRPEFPNPDSKHPLPNSRRPHPHRRTAGNHRIASATRHFATHRRRRASLQPPPARPPALRARTPHGRLVLQPLLLPAGAASSAGDLPVRRVPSRLPAGAPHRLRRLLRPRGAGPPAAGRAPYPLHRWPTRRRQASRGLQPLPRLPWIRLLPSPLRKILPGSPLPLLQPLGMLHR
jgi:hypothetical protein